MSRYKTVTAEVEVSLQDWDDDDIRDEFVSRGLELKHSPMTDFLREAERRGVFALRAQESPKFLRELLRAAWLECATLPMPPPPKTRLLIELLEAELPL